jgi:hypothetical protein
MITKLLLPKLQKEFSGRKLRLSAPPEPCAVFTAVHPEVGDIVIHDDGREATVYVGNFTHSHFSHYEEGIAAAQAAEKVADDIVDFLEKLFADEIVMWGCHHRSGGWYRRGLKAKTPFPNQRGKEYVWTGPLPTATSART